MFETRTNRGQTCCTLLRVSLPRKPPIVSRQLQTVRTGVLLLKNGKQKRDQGLVAPPNAGSGASGSLAEEWQANTGTGSCNSSESHA